MEGLVSVIVPVYNVERYLKTCLDSIAGQTYKNLEIILCDDGSTDESGAICDEYAERDDRIQVVHKANGGAAEARNCGLERATGAYLAFVDSDDAIHARFIEILMTLAQGKDADLVVGDYTLFREADECQDKALTEADIAEAQVLSEQHLYDDDFIKRETVRFVVPWGKLYRKKLFDGIFYPVGIVNEDTHTTYRVIEKANKVVYLKEPLYYWRENMASVTRSKFTLAQLSGLDAYMEQLEYFHSAGKQRYVEVVFDAYWDWFFGCYNEMLAAGMDYKEALKPYYEYARRHIKYAKLTKSLGVYTWLKYRYLVWYKLPRWF